MLAYSRAQISMITVACCSSLRYIRLSMDFHWFVPVSGGTVSGMYRFPVERFPVRTGHRWNGFRFVPVSGEAVSGWYRFPVERLPLRTGNR